MPTQAAFKQSITGSIAAIAKDLQDDLGQRLVAYVTEVQSPKSVGRWARGDVPPRPEAENRLRDLYRTVLILREVYGAETIRAWLEGSNPDLRNHAPIEVLRKGGSAASVFEAADSFIK
jgi:hypothetical protein